MGLIIKFITAFSPESIGYGGAIVTGSIQKTGAIGVGIIQVDLFAVFFIHAFDAVVGGDTAVNAFIFVGAN